MTSSSSLVVPGGSFSHPAWRMLLIAFLAQNCAIGMNFGIYGTIVGALETGYHTNRTLAASGLAFMTLLMGLLSPLMGGLMRRFSIRTLMLVGTLVNAAGYGLLTVAPNIEAVLAIYTFVIGPGVCLLGPISASTLANNWFLTGRGRVLGFVNMPLFVAIFPVLTAIVLPRFGLAGVFAMAALVSLAFVPLAMTVISAPADRGLRSFGDDGSVPAATDAADLSGQGKGRILTTREIHRSRSFQMIWLCIGLLTAGGVMMTTHIVSMAVEKGLALQPASLLLSVFGISATAGALLFGWLADRIGGQRAVVVQALGWTVPWTAMLLLGPALLPLIAVAGLTGLISGGIVGLCAVMINAWLGPQNFPAAMGNVYFYKVPFLFGAAPLAGHLFDRTGSYDVPILIHIATFLLVAMIFALFRPKIIGQAA